MGVDFSRGVLGGGKVRPRTLLSERSKLRGHVLPHPKECYGVLGGYQWPANEVTQKAKMGHLRSPGDQCDARLTNMSGVARGEKASQGH
jgi:hypothetical protein